MLWFLINEHGIYCMNLLKFHAKSATKLLSQSIGRKMRKTFVFQQPRLYISSEDSKHEEYNAIQFMAINKVYY